MFSAILYSLGDMVCGSIHVYLEKKGCLFQKGESTIVKAAFK